MRRKFLNFTKRNFFSRFFRTAEFLPRALLPARKPKRKSGQHPESATVRQGIRLCARAAFSVLQVPGPFQRFEIQLHELSDVQPFHKASFPFIPADRFGGQSRSQAIGGTRCLGPAAPVWLARNRRPSRICFIGLASRNIKEGEQPHKEIVQIQGRAIQLVGQKLHELGPDQRQLDQFGVFNVFGRL